jgi:hypothetical protein
MSIAWTALFHAIFYKRKQKPWYVDSGSGRGKRYVKIEGEPKHWDLNECIRQYYGKENPPERENLRFLVGLRNKIEHRHLPALDAPLYGECQATLLNFENRLAEEFGNKWGLAENLAISLQFTSMLPDEKQESLRALGSSAAQDVLEYVRQFRAELPEEVLNSTAYSFRVFLVPKTANRHNNADMAVEFVPYDPSRPEEMKELEKVTALIKEKSIGVTEKDKLKPKQVVAKVDETISHPMNMHVHTRCWKFFQVRPKNGAENPYRTDDRYCVYAEAHGDYVYTDAWVRKLVRELEDADRYKEIVGRDP